MMPFQCIVYAFCIYTKWKILKIYGFTISALPLFTLSIDTFYTISADKISVAFKMQSSRTDVEQYFYFTANTHFLSLPPPLPTQRHTPNRKVEKPKSFYYTYHQLLCIIITILLRKICANIHLQHKINERIFLGFSSYRITRVIIITQPVNEVKCSNAYINTHIHRENSAKLTNNQIAKIRINNRMYTLIEMNPDVCG